MPGPYTMPYIIVGWCCCWCWWCHEAVPGCCIAGAAGGTIDGSSFGTGVLDVDSEPLAVVVFLLGDIQKYPDQKKSTRIYPGH